MFFLKTESELTCKAEGQGHFFAKKGAMIAEQGQFKYEKILLDPNNTGLVGAVVNNVTRRITGENMEIMKVQGSGICYLADEAQHVTILDLEQGESVLVESENLLAFTENCKYGVKMIGAGIISQKGLFTTKITALNGKAQVAIKTNGNPIILQGVCKVDPDAVVCWTGPDPGFKLDVNWKTLIGQTSGESYMLEFKDPSQIIVIQPFERTSGISLRDTDRPHTQSSNFLGNSSNNNSSNNAPSNSNLGTIGDITSGLSNIFNRH